MIKAPILIFIVQIIAVLILCISCREVYFPNDLEESNPILSVHGIVYENEQPVIKLSWSIGYYEQKEKPVNNAVVIITDDYERADTLPEFEQRGIYTTSFNIPYEIGSIYTLQIETEDGNIYTSNPVKIPPRPVVEDYYSIMSNKEIFSYTAEGKIMKYSVPGALVFTELSSDGGESLYYRFRTKVIEQRGYVIPPNTQYESFTLKKSNDLYDIAKSDDQQMVTRHEDIFLEEPGEPVYTYDYITHQTTYSFFMSYLIAHKIYSISPDVYEFYASMKNQLTAEDEIFAPVPSKIRSNIFCINNNEARVIGVFEASSTLTLYMSCKISHDFLSTNLLDSPPSDLPVFAIPEYPAITP